MSAQSFLSSAMHAVVGVLAGVVARVWLATLRIRWSVHPDLVRHHDKPWVLAHWHGQILPLLAYRRRKSTIALVSRSADGDAMVRALRFFDLIVVRGSSSRGGREGLARVVEGMLGGLDSVIAVDGPRGPRHRPKPGAIVAAARAGGVVAPFAAWCGRCWRLRSWDQFELPLPFSRVGIVIGAPLLPSRPPGRQDPDLLARAIHGAERDARLLVSNDVAKSDLWNQLERA